MANSTPSRALESQVSPSWPSGPGRTGPGPEKTYFHDADTQFYAMFDVSEDKEQDDEPILDETKLEDLENEQLHGETQ